MEQTNITDKHTTIIGKPSWVAYLRVSIRLFALFMVSCFTTLFTESVVLQYAFVFGISLSYLIYRIMYIRSVVLYTNQEGVWFHRGVFPWQKGISGVLWRDLDSAVFYPNFLSWICRSYNVQLTHRHTKSNEMLLRDIAHGHRVVEEINRIHRDLYAQQA